MSSVELESMMCRIHYAATHKYYGHIVLYCSNFLKNINQSDPVIRFWHIFGMALHGDLNGSIRELTQLLKNPSFRSLRFAIEGALIEYHKLSASASVTPTTSDTFSHTPSPSTSTASPLSLIQLSLLFSYLDKHFESKELLENPIIPDSYEDPYCSLSAAKGWIYLRADKEVLSFECETIFQHHYESAMFQMGKIQFFLRNESGAGGAGGAGADEGIKKALQCVNQLLVRRPRLGVVAVQKAKILILLNQDWEEANRICEGILTRKTTSFCLDASVISLICLMTKGYISSSIMSGGGGGGGGRDRDVGGDRGRGRSRGDGKDGHSFGEGGGIDVVKAIRRRFRRLMRQVRSTEGRNHRLLYRLARCFATIAPQTSVGSATATTTGSTTTSSRRQRKSRRSSSSGGGGNGDILDVCLTMITTAIDVQPLEVDYFSLQGMLFLLKGGDYYEHAQRSYSRAIELDESSIGANVGLVKALLKQKRYPRARQMLESLNEIREAFVGDFDDISVELDDDLIGEGGKMQQMAPISSAADASSAFVASKMAFLNYLLLWHADKDRDGALEHLEEAIRLFRHAVDRLSFSLDYYSYFNPRYLLEIADELLLFCPSDPIARSDKVPMPLAKLHEVMTMLVESVPASVEGHFRLAHGYFLMGRFDSATRMVEQVSRLDSTYVSAHILGADIAFRQKQYRNALSSLDVALSLDFAVKDDPKYNLLKARVCIAMKDESKALNILETAMNYMKRKKSLSTSLEVEFLIELARVHGSLKSRSAAMEGLQRASELAEGLGTGDLAERVVFADAQVHVSFSEFVPAINILERIPRESPLRLAAVQEMALIYLDHLRNKSKYVELFQMLLAEEETKDRILLLGEAYMKIHEPELAIRMYKRALQLDPKNYFVMSLIGEALVTTHRYREAIQYYQDALQANREEFQLRFDLARLFVMLEQHEQAKSLMTETMQEIQALKNPKPITIKRLVKIMKLLSDIEKRNGNYAEAYSILQKATTVQDGLVQLLRGAEEDEDQQKRLLADLHFEMGQLTKHDETRRMRCYADALRVFPLHEGSLIAQAKAFLQKGALHQAESNARTITSQINETSEEAILMLGEVKFRRRRHMEAISHFEDLLQANPHNFGVLARLIKLFRSHGKLGQSEKYLQRATSRDGGFHYCMALFQRYAGNRNEALHHFYEARRSDVWCESATVHMVEIYLNEEIDFLNPQHVSSSVALTPQQRKNIADADQLLRDAVFTSTPADRVELLNAYCSLANRDRASYHAALEKMMALHQQNRHNVCALVGLATSLLMINSVTKARNYLSNVMRVDYDDDYAEEFERAWMILAHMHITKGKYDLALETLKLALQRNEGCRKAWDLLGHIYEREMSYSDASDCYWNAWKLGNQSSAETGYKLAFNLLKGKRYVKAIDICHRVLKIDPEYPKIKQQILDRARVKLRP